ncbi:MAG: restriction endonuclease, partial [Alphaproteobacteria bacterium]
IVATQMRRDPDGAEHPEQWFVQCKRYEKGVPPETLQGALAWSTAERPAVLVFAVSNFLSNPSKTFLEDYSEHNRPPFKIRIWERKDLERMLAGRVRLIARFGLEPEAPYVGAHKAHIEYLFSNPINTLRYLFEQFDAMEATDRDELLDYAYFALLASSHLASSGPHAKPPKLRKKMTYEDFRAASRHLRGTVTESFLVRAIVSWTLAWWWPNANPASVAESHQRQSEMVAHLLDRARKSEDAHERSKWEGAAAFVQRQLDDLPRRHARAVVLYNQFCDTVLPRLYLEDVVGGKRGDA